MKALVGQPFVLGGHGKDGKGLTGKINTISLAATASDGALFSLNFGQSYVLCSKTRPTVAIKPSPKWLALGLNLGSDAQVSEATAWAFDTYLAACHGGGDARDSAGMVRLGHAISI